MPKVSVIIPLYKAEDYIERCAISLFEQTLDDIEYVFVDDCTSDNSISVLYDVARRYPQRHSQMRVLTHEINKGVAHARITGIRNATGDYIIHCDSDDWVDKDMYETMYLKAICGNCDLVVCDYMNVYSEHYNICTPCYYPHFLQALLLCNCTGSLCNKLVKRQVLFNNDFIYPTASYCEDYVYSIQYAIYSSNIGYIPSPFYKYCHRDGSMVTSKTRNAINKRISENMENHMLIEKILSEKGLSQLYSSELIALRLIVKNSIRMHLPQKGYYKLWLRTFPELTVDIFKSRQISWRSRIAYFITMLGLYPLFKKI